MTRFSRWWAPLACASFFIACGGPNPAADAGMDGAVDAATDAGTDAGPPNPAAPAPFDGVEQTGRFPVPGLTGQAHVVHTELDVPHIYAENRLDAMRVLGFVMARDRFFQMDLTRRLSEGRISELLGDKGLSSDIQNRETGGAYVTDLFLNGLNEDEAAEVDAFADGINAYIQAVRITSPTRRPSWRLATRCSVRTAQPT